MRLLDWWAMKMHTPSEDYLMLHSDAQGLARGAIVFDPGLTRQPEPEWFDPQWWGKRAQTIASGGRGAAWFVDSPFGHWVLRQYRRGGFAARISRRHYVWQGESRVRSVAEFRLMQQLHAQRLPVPAPIAAAYWRDGPLYRAAIVMERLLGVRSLAQQLAENSAATQWEDAGRLIARFHRAGLDHADLNAHNILFAKNGDAWLIDFDRGRLRAIDDAWRERNLGRLQRSVRKLRGAHTIRYIDAQFAQLRTAYDRAWQAAA